VGEVTIKLVSFALCLFVQRLVIVLREKQIEHEIEYIDLEQPPEWFLRLSPSGKVPLMLVDNEVLFESSVILDFLDEAFAPRFHPAEIIKRAQYKAWIEYGSSLLMGQYTLATASDRDTMIEKKMQLERELDRLAQPLEANLFGKAGRLTLVDAAFAPLFMRLQYQALLHEEGRIQMPAYVLSWSERLLSLSSVRLSVVEDFFDCYRAFLLNNKSWLVMA
jgi:glutathione S-transferase